MGKKPHNWLTAVVSMVVTVALLAGGSFLWGKYAVAKPLDKLPQGIDGVRQVTWEDDGRKDGRVKINVRLHNVANLQASYNQLLDNSKKILGNRKFIISIQDNRTPEMERFYYRIHYHIQEAISTGKFAAMAEYVQSEAQKYNLKAQLYVDSSYVYLQMSRDEAEMYVVIPRQ